ncbi:hypothetical protein D3C72_2064370 [compost metagenome]
MREDRPLRHTRRASGVLQNGDVLGGLRDFGKNAPASLENRVGQRLELAIAGGAGLLSNVGVYCDRREFADNRLHSDNRCCQYMSNAGFIQYLPQ